MPYADVLGPGARKMPNVFRDLNLPKSIGVTECIEVAAPNYNGEKDTESGILNLDQLVLYTRKLAQVIKEVVSDGKFPIVIGGDCSILLGSMLALKQIGKYGLAHIDGHTDFAIGNKTSITGGAAGMDLAIVIGQGSDSITNIYGEKPYVLQSDVAQFGNRYHDQVFNGMFYKTNILKYDLDRLREDGVDSSARSFLSQLNSHVKGFWIHVDLDVLDDEIMPAVDSRQRGGLSYEELAELLITLLRSEIATGIQFTIYDPDLDEDRKIGEVLVRKLIDILQNI